MLAQGMGRGRVCWMFICQGLAAAQPCSDESGPATVRSGRAGRPISASRSAAAKRSLLCGSLQCSNAWARQVFDQGCALGLGWV